MEYIEHLLNSFQPFPAFSKYFVITKQRLTNSGRNRKPIPLRPRLTPKERVACLDPRLERSQCPGARCDVAGSIPSDDVNMLSAN